MELEEKQTTLQGGRQGTILKTKAEEAKTQNMIARVGFGCLDGSKLMRRSKMGASWLLVRKKNRASAGARRKSKLFADEY